MGERITQRQRKKATPLMRQYYQIKRRYPDTILLFRLGDFYETFEEDAFITARVCNITLTKRNNGSAGDVPMAGFPYHQLDNYLPKLVRAGYRVAVCEQLEDPKKARGIVRRDVVEVVTPGVTLNEKLLDAKLNNYVAALWLFRHRQQSAVALSYADVSTGEFYACQLQPTQLRTTLETIQPAEILLSKSQRKEIEHLLSTLSYTPTLTRMEEWLFEENFARETLLRHFSTSSLKGFGIDHLPGAVVAAGAVLHYLSETQKGMLEHIRAIRLYNPSEYMALDFATRRNLEIFYTFDGSRQGSLFQILDKTLTPMGGRLFKKWLSSPLRRLEPIVQRLEAVDAFVTHREQRRQLQEILRSIGDSERIVSRIAVNRALPRDYVLLRHMLECLPQIQQLLAPLSAKMLRTIEETLNPLPELATFLANAFVDEPGSTPGSGEIFRPGFSPQLDELLEALHNGQQWIKAYQERERKRTGIPSLKVGFNNVFGYYIEITHAHRKKVPAEYERKQTLTAAERYTTPELKEIEAKILNAEEQIAELERQLLQDVRAKVLESAEALQQNAHLLAMLDCFQSFAEAAEQYQYCKPHIDESERLEIINGRHPVIEQLLPVGERYVPNSTKMDTEHEQIHILTGPNMSGKSSYLRQVGLIVLLAQIGSFVPADRAHIGLVDMIFTRVGAQDNITAGESTFLVEMLETAYILHNATRKSLILLDEVGRGTATFDGISIAWAIAEYLHNVIGAKTIFATHYHELTALADHLPRLHNYHVEVEEIEGNLLFTHKVKPGYTDHSFGIHVARMAGIPEAVLRRAAEILQQLETQAVDLQSSTAQPPARHAPVANIAPPSQLQLTLFTFQDEELRQRIRSIDLHNTTPLEALRILEELQRYVQS